MKLLLDTHVWLWALLSPDKLSATVRRQIENPKNEVYLSPVSIWEAHHLARRKRVRVTNKDFGRWLEERLASAPLKEAPFHFAVAAEAARIELPQADVGDVFLAATASVFGLTLVTADEQLLNCRWLKTLPAQ